MRRKHQERHVMDMDVSVSILKHTFEIAFSDIYPDISVLNNWHYSFDDILNQLIFELIKEEYKKYAEKHSVQYFLRQYDYEQTSRPYTRAIQYAQFYSDFTNDNITEAFGFRLPELEPQDVTGSNKFMGHQFTEAEFIELKMQTDCWLLNKLHGLSRRPHRSDSRRRA